MPENVATANGEAIQAQSLPIVAENLTYLADARKLLDVEYLEITAGGPTVFLGPNGAGKSLFLRLLHGLIQPTSGTIRFRNTQLDPASRRGQAMVFQNPVLLRRSVAANIEYALKVHDVKRAKRRGKVQQLLAQSGLSGQGGQSARTLSGGEQQRLAFVRAMAGDPDILFLDEPTSSLDPQASGEIENMITQATNAGTKIVLVTHDLGLARRTSVEIVFLSEGRVCEKTSCENFFQRPSSPEGRTFLARNQALIGETDD